MPQNPKQISPLTLAFLGDGVYELMVRDHLVRQHGSMPPRKLHQLCVRYVRASAQYRAMQLLYDGLTEEEQTIFRRGRNASGMSVPKNACPTEYRYATGFEALWGYLFLKGEHQRLQQLFAQLLTLDLEGQPPPTAE